jgi:hypothetical protein
MGARLLPQYTNNTIHIHLYYIHLHILGRTKERLTFLTLERLTRPLSANPIPQTRPHTLPNYKCGNKCFWNLALCLECRRACEDSLSNSTHSPNPGVVRVNDQPTRSKKWGWGKVLLIKLSSQLSRNYERELSPALQNARLNSSEEDRAFNFSALSETWDGGWRAFSYCWLYYYSLLWNREREFL